MTDEAKTDKPKILVVDDEVGLLQMMKLTLEQARPYEVTTERDGTKAAGLAAKLRPDVILLDVMMPGIDGGALATQLRAQSSTSHIPIVFLTAAVREDEVRGHGGVIGGDVFLAKPVSTQRLIEVIEKAISA